MPPKSKPKANPIQTRVGYITRSKQKLNDTYPQPNQPVHFNRKRIVKYAEKNPVSPADQLALKRLKTESNQRTISDPHTDEEIQEEIKVQSQSINADESSQSSDDEYVEKQQQAKGLQKGLLPKNHARRIVIDQKIEDLIIQLSPKYALSFQQLNLERYDAFSQLAQVKKDNIYKWYVNRHKYYLKNLPVNDPAQFVKAINFPIPISVDDVVLSLISPFLPPNERDYLASCLQQSLPPIFREYYTNKILLDSITQIENSNSMEIVKKILLEIPVSIRLKATAKALVVFKSKDEFKDDDGYKLSWFNNCIKPVFSLSESFHHYTKEEIESINEICIFNGPQRLDQTQALCYINLLVKGGLLNFDDLFHWYGNQGDDFWSKVLKATMINDALACILIKNKQVLLTQSFFNYHFKYSADVKFAELAARFKKMTLNELVELAKLQQHWSFDGLTELLDINIKHDFTQFRYQIATYLQMENTQQVDAYKATLKNKPLDKWAEHKNVVIATDSFMNAEKALSIVKETFVSFYKSCDLVAPTEEQKQELSKEYELAFTSISQRRPLTPIQWQKEVVVNLAHLLVNLNQNNILISLGTGHGKSIIIQTLADVLVNIDKKKSNIATLTKFLANWAKMAYGGVNMLNKKINYLTVKDLVEMNPLVGEYLIVDEIDQMVGRSSFYHVDTGDSIECIHTSSLFDKWKAMVGFSGSLSEATIMQLREELNNPLCLIIPSLRNQGLENKLAMVVEASDDDDDLKGKVAKRIGEMRAKINNFVVIMKDENDVQTLVARKDFITATIGLKLKQFTMFAKNYASIEKDLQDLTQDHFVVVTTQEGGRGIDYKGLTASHVIIGFNPESHSQCMQALGRGCRNLGSFAEGTIVAKKPLSTDPLEMMHLLATNDMERAEGLELNSKVAREFHKITIKKTDSKEAAERFPEKRSHHLAILYFQTFMQEGSNFRYHDHGKVLWSYLREIKENSKMPLSYHQEWI